MAILQRLALRIQQRNKIAFRFVHIIAEVQLKRRSGHLYLANIAFSICVDLLHLCLAVIHRCLEIEIPASVKPPVFIPVRILLRLRILFVIRIHHLSTKILLYLLLLIRKVRKRAFLCAQPVLSHCLLIFLSQILRHWRITGLRQIADQLVNMQLHIKTLRQRYRFTFQLAVDSSLPGVRLAVSDQCRCQIHPQDTRIGMIIHEFSIQIRYCEGIHVFVIRERHPAASSQGDDRHAKLIHHGIREFAF